ncbi:MAG: hypothetical protein JWQ44_1626 [Chthoniobacter sp.]|nr:hypothetical protein [Chthoniobacter sp.]
MYPLLRVILLLLVCVGSALAAAPSVTDPTANPLPEGRATLSAKVTANGDFTTVTFHYGLSDKYGSTRSTTANGTAAGETVSVEVSDLIGGQEYHFKVIASNSDGTSETADGIFVEPAYLPTLQLLAPANLGAGKVILRARVTTNGSGPGEVFFLYAPPTPPELATDPVGVDQDTIGQLIEAELSNLKRNVTYSYRLIYREPNKPDRSSDIQTFTTANLAPVATADVFSLANIQPITLDVLKNDRDGDSDPIKLVSVTDPEHGTALIRGDKVVYTPDSTFRGRDTFEYGIEDDFGGSATGVVTIRSPRASLSGMHGGLLKDEKGRDVGYLQINALPGGAFTGTLKIGNETYGFQGMLTADGKYRGSVFVDGEMISFSLNTTQTDLGTNIIADFGNGRWMSDASFTDAEVARRAELAGRYTVQLPGGGTSADSGTDAVDPDQPDAEPGETQLLPEGTGWAAIKIREDGSAKIKGRLPDGSSFSTRGLLVAGADGAQVIFYDEVDDSRVVASFTLGASVSGNLRIDRDKSSNELFPKGFDVNVAVTGAAYVPSEEGITGSGESEDATITFSGGGYSGTYSRTIRVDENGKVKVPEPNSELLRVKIDRESGRFQTKLKLDDSGKRLKGSGVLVQGSGLNGAGLFKGPTQTGKITLSLGVVTPPAPELPPDPDPVVDPDPGVVPDPVP